MADIDHFKKVNDTYGHLVGDEVLIETSKRLKAEIRFGDIVGRFGGEEFIIVLLDVNSEQLIKIMENLRFCIERSEYSVVGRRIPITMSFGGTVLDARPYPLEEGIRVADMALYESKNKGRDCVSYIEFKESY